MYNISMKNKSANFIQLENYFNDLVNSNQDIPFITGASIETGISAATISRFAKQKGFYGYPDYRASLMNSVTGPEKDLTFSEEAIKLFDFLSNNDKIVIYTSQSTKPIGHFLLDRLKTFKEDVVMLEDLFALSTAEYGAITISVSNESARVDKFLSGSKKFKEVISISCLPKNKKNEIVLSDMMYSKRTNTELFKSMRKMNNWIQETIDDFVKL